MSAASGLMGRARLLAALTAAARRSTADRTLIACQRGGQTTLRFAHGRFHQTFHAESLDVWVKVACGGRVGVAATNALSPEALRRAVQAAIAIAQVGGRRRLAAMPAAAGDRPAPLMTHRPETVARPITETIATLATMWRRAERDGDALAGSFTAGEEELAVAGSEGVARYQPFTVAGVKIVATHGGRATGYAAATSRDLARLDLHAVAEQAVQLARANARPRTLPLGRYDVLLEPDAVAELLEWLGYIAFGAKAFAERTSPLAGRLGDRLMHETVSISDDALHPQGLAMPFDYEGVPTQRVALIERGVASGVVFDTAYGALYHRRSTGHGMPYDESEGPLPTHLTISAGTTPRAAMERLLGDGLVIHRFHYVNGLLDTRRALMTGLTRDGTFLVRRGQRVGAVKNLRFTEPILEAFSRVAALSRERRLIADPGSGLGGCLVPAMLIRNFTFTGTTQ
ncbi:MAG: TldD/PmbA family protein [Candidatus Omnitrophica bacterium]|nr:TldD/PmbA family protein [Candidatus Omnitrophota bacterium]